MYAGINVPGCDVCASVTCMARLAAVLVIAQIHRDHRAAPAQQDLGATLTDLAEGAGDEDGLAVHRPNLRATAAPASRKRGEMRTENTGLNTSSRSRVSVEVLISHRPSTFS